ncbi:zinc-dependent alcohol dehydrogenase family protein [Pseudomonas sp. ZM23]|uniref:Zinc-dependent alcohol dehydrogenase family protein n=1 Tax=Pseudomonas triclosanedens TaxID=2961893 RepID=A0ABY7A6V8_9PSED|nr:zinc-dependent alcohol dehydrogenase family protein [Pseudomonas triclosanedens]MCP8465774.1 zinc-dependent alcohol dehydrogenase family protein [Pseudomonas triclosanedens]MCP8471269.1 zinc-dependent alcohol dehydrogenase family protein [Pseudomonas triclosanedens]MCP8477073.1 zinc-dependent alcohol dehydrogenase family protein [Pseudomonas triclosanedens]WAI51819.1 zinc-dependent alcohol dehydrogenase family protein [Pseudomonas triclosanedens]
MSRMIRFHQFGDASVLKIEEMPTPQPGPGEVLIRTQALGVSWRDVLWRQNLAPDQAKLPAGIGYELSGIVEAVGDGVDDLEPGVAVASFPANSPNLYPAWGDHVVLPRTSLTRYPEVLTPVEAAVHYTGLLYSYFALVELAQIKPGQRVLITEAGHCLAPQAVQLAKALGAQVIATTSHEETREFLKGLGADKIIYTEEQDLVLEVERFTKGQGVEIVLDQCAGPQMKLLGDVAAPRGKLILYGINGGNDAAFPACAAFKKHLQFYRHCVLDFTGQPDIGLVRNDEAVQRALTAINQMTADQLLKPSIDRVFDFAQYHDANCYMETCPGGGRVVMKMPE